MIRTHTLMDGRVLKLVDVPRGGAASCDYCMANREDEDNGLCSRLPPCIGSRAWMDDTAWAKYVAEEIMK